MPSHDRLGANKADAANGVGNKPIDPDKQQSIQAAENDTLGYLPAKNAKLMAKDQDLSFDPSP